MALSDENGMVMPVSPMYGNGGGFGGFGGDNGWWVILFFILLCNGGWGNGFGGGFGGGNELYPWMNQAEITNDGFRDQMINSNIEGIQSAVNGISTQLCNGFAGVNQNVSNGFATAEIADNSRQMANMNQNFAMQTAITGAISDVSSQLAQCLKKISRKAKEIFGFTRLETVGTYA